MTKHPNVLAGILLISLAWAATVAADELEQLPDGWKDALLPIAAADISGAEPRAQQSLHAARQELSELLQRPIKAEGKRALARAYGNLGNLYQLYAINTLAERCYSNAQRLEPNSFRWRYYAGHLALAEGRLEEAIEQLLEAERIDPEYRPVTLRLGQARFDLNQTTRARERLLQAAAVPETRAAANYYLGQIALLQRDYGAAVERLNSVLAADPDASRAHYPLARAYRGLGQTELAREHLAKRGDRMPAVDDPLVLELEALEKGARRFFARGMEAIEEGQYAQGVDAFRTGVARDPGNLNARISLARALYLAGDGAGAKQNLESVLAEAPDKPLANFLLAVLLDAGDQSKPAEAGYQKVLASDPDHTGASFFLANRMLRAGSFDLALQYYTKTLAGDADNPFALLFQLVAAYGAGEPHERLAERLLAARTAHPDLQPLDYARARLLAISRNPGVRNPAVALELAQNLVYSMPVPPHLELLALAFAASGEYQQALSIQEQLISDAAWMGMEGQRSRLEESSELYRQRRLPHEPWPAGDPILTPQPPNPAMVFREYPSPVPF